MIEIAKYFWSADYHKNLKTSDGRMNIHTIKAIWLLKWTMDGASQNDNMSYMECAHGLNENSFKLENSHTQSNHRKWNEGHSPNLQWIKHKWHTYCEHVLKIHQNPNNSNQTNHKNNFKKIQKLKIQKPSPHKEYRCGCTQCTPLPGGWKYLSWKFLKTNLKEIFKTFSWFKIFKMFYLLKIFFQIKNKTFWPHRMHSSASCGLLRVLREMCVGAFFCEF